jgi:hypothetical protein
MGVKGLPTLKFYKHQYGGERLGEVYDGARDYATLRNFVIDTLGPQCSDGERCYHQSSRSMNKYAYMNYM